MSFLVLFSITLVIPDCSAVQPGLKNQGSTDPVQMTLLPRRLFLTPPSSIASLAIFEVNLSSTHSTLIPGNLFLNACTKYLTGCIASESEPSIREGKPIKEYPELSLWRPVSQKLIDPGPG